MPIPAVVFAEFSFLSQHFDQRQLVSAVVSRWHLDFIETTTLPRSYEGMWTEVYFFSQDGSLVHRAGWVKTWWGGSRHMITKVGQALAELGSDMERVCYGVKHFDSGNALIIYKPPQGYDSVAAWFRVEMKRETERA